jgi:hypothetical protein
MSFAQRMTLALPPGLAYPPELIELFDWLEASGHARAGAATLAHPDQPCFRYDERQQKMIVLQGTDIAFFPSEGPWGELPPDRVHVFARSGGDGSRLALWRDDQGRSRVVHLGSGSGSVWWGCVGQVPLDLLLLLGLGYLEIAIADQLRLRPAEVPDVQLEGLNEPYRAWLVQRWGLAVPECGVDVIPADPCWDDHPSEDPFWLFVRAHSG